MQASTAAESESGGSTSFSGSGGSSAVSTGEGWGYYALQQAGIRTEGLPIFVDEEELADGNADEDGLAAWPLGLLILPPGPQTKELRNEVETLLKLALKQASKGPVSPRLVSKIKWDLGKLRRLLNGRADAMPVADETIAEARGFLEDLQDFVEAL